MSKSIGFIGLGNMGLYRLAQAKGHGKDDSSSVIATIREAYGK